mmetsp:Transcript_24703/g.40968  ORF Transcript_24703/g.40968 Transcript_24703/m.40968 type:complete len:203 (+) Transcript_24703:744-1352(+)
MSSLSSSPLTSNLPKSNAPRQAPRPVTRTMVNHAMKMRTTLCPLRFSVADADIASGRLATKQAATNASIDPSSFASSAGLASPSTHKMPITNDSGIASRSEPNQTTRADAVSLWQLCSTTDSGAFFRPAALLNELPRRLRTGGFRAGVIAPSASIRTSDFRVAVLCAVLRAASIRRITGWITERACTSCALLPFSGGISISI